MKHVAELAGVAQSTVSRVLSGDTSLQITGETRQRVLAVVADLGYRPNAVARALRSSRTGLLGLIVRDIEDPFFATAISALTAEANRLGYRIVLGHVHSSADEALELRGVFETEQCDGLFLVGDVRDQERLWSTQNGPPLPMVGLWQGHRAPAIPVVNADNRLGVRRALEYLYTLGHRRIAFLQGGRTGDGFERRDAYLESMRGEGLPEPRTYTCENDLRSAVAVATEVLSGADRPSAVLASTDVVALSVIKAASDLGVRVPADLSVVGFDDIPLAAYTVPSLTTLHQPIAQIARLAVEQLVALIAGSQAVRSSQTVPPTLIKRGSCAPPAEPSLAIPGPNGRRSEEGEKELATR